MPKQKRKQRRVIITPEQCSGSLPIGVVNSLEPEDHWRQYLKAVTEAREAGRLEQIVGTIYSEALTVILERFEPVAWGLYENGFLAALAVLEARELLRRAEAGTVPPADERIGRA